MKKAISPVMGKAGMKTSFASMPSKSLGRSGKSVNHGKKIPFNVAQFHAKKGNVTN